MPSSMRKEYASLPKGGNLPRSQFNLTKTHKTTFNGGYLVPIHWDIGYPGEVFRGSVQAFVRMLSPLEVPLMDNMKLTVHWYSAPIRILWTNFRKFMGEQTDPGDSIAYTIPEYGNTAAWDSSAAGLRNSLAHYLGVPQRTAAQGGVDEADISALPFRAYNAIYNWHYRDQQQQDSIYTETGDGPDTAGNYVVRYRGKRHDYFTSALPAPVKGDAVPVQQFLKVDSGSGATVAINSTTTGLNRLLDSDAANVDLSATTTTDSTKYMYTELLVSELRNAAAIQQFLERDNRYGTRFDELIYSHFGVEFNDVRIAPVYLGGGTGYISTSAIPNQSGTTGNLGDLAAIATGVLDGASFTYAFDEPSILMCIVNVSADLSYMQGLDRKFSYRSRYDLFWPEFVGIGDQSILMKELYYQNTADDDTVFGYVPRYEELRTGINRITSDLNVWAVTPLETWHLGQELGSLPALGDAWIKDGTPYSRIQQVAAAFDFIGDFRVNIKAARHLPVNGVPGLGRL